MSIEGQLLIDARSEGHASTTKLKHEFWTYLTGNSLAVLLGLCVAYVALLSNHSITSSTVKTGDFLAYFSGAHLVATGHGARLYDFSALQHVQTSLLRPLVNRPVLMPYLYPAFLALLMAPLGALPYAGAFIAWLVINCLLLILFMFAFERYAGLSGRSALLTRLAAIASLPVLFSLFNGQTSLLILASFGLSFLALRAGRDWLAGAALAIGIIKVPYVLPVLLVFLVLRRWQAVTAFALTALSLLVIPVVFLGASVNSAYGQTLIKAISWHQEFGYAAARNDSFAGFSQLLFPANVAAAVRIVLCIVGILGLVWCALNTSSIDLPFGLAVVVALLVSPHVLVHDLVLLLLPVSVALHHRDSGPAHLLWLLRIAYCTVLLGYWVAFITPLQLPVLAMSALVVWLLLATRQGEIHQAHALSLRLEPMESVG